MKRICSIHHFSYSGNVCPFCEKDRIDSLAHRFVKTESVKHKKEKNIEKEISENDLQKLMNKFNVKH